MLWLLGLVQVLTCTGLLLLLLLLLLLVLRIEVGVGSLTLWVGGARDTVWIVGHAGVASLEWMRARVHVAHLAWLLAQLWLCSGGARHLWRLAGLLQVSIVVLLVLAVRLGLRGGSVLWGAFLLDLLADWLFSLRLLWLLFSRLWLWLLLRNATVLLLAHVQTAKLHAELVNSVN